jgi:hypothetical protein
MARVNEQLAEQLSKTALSRQLAVDAVNQVRDDRLDLGLLLSIESNRIDKTVIGSHSGIWRLADLLKSPRLSKGAA